MANVNKAMVARRRRHERVRKHVVGTTERPRLNVYRSLGHIYAQIVDDSRGETLVAASSLDTGLQKELADKNKSERAVAVGKLLAERALGAGIKQVVFDRGGYQYHGRVKALADASREGGLEF